MKNDDHYEINKKKKQKRGRKAEGEKKKPNRKVQHIKL